MFPLSDTAPRRRFPFINYLIIGLNVYMFYLQMTAPSFEEFTFAYAFVPAYFRIGDPSTYWNVLYSIFMHGGFLHIISNMWTLFIFGDNIEDRLGHIPYALFYIAGGFIATLGQYLISPSSIIPMIGASGAIAAVIGAYFIWFRRDRVRTLVPTLFGFWDIIEIPVWFFMGYWILIQLLSGFGSLVAFNINEGGVAWFAHIGGFAFGFLFASIL
jgi:membrane associated rhomboid family serine protease